jgi:hypothetical protein
MSAVPLTRRPAFWIAYAALAAVALAIAWKLFPLAIPLVNLDVRLSRDEAIAKALEIGGAQGLAPPAARTAARFASDARAQNYIELEGGGKPAFAALIGGDVYSPYAWEVRLFAPGEPAEAVIRFRPDGAPWGFTRKLPETFVPDDPAGLALDEQAARALGERAAREDWGVDLAAYRLLESAQQKRPTGRVDHTFVYERASGNLGESRFRLRLAVSGNAVTEVARYVHVPESFERRFREMRSANDAIAGTASLAALALYGIGGCLLGVLWLARKRFLLWRPAVAAGFAVGALLGAASLASASAAWFGFDTAQAAGTFWLREAAKAAAAALGGGLLLALVFMAAESLSRRAFPDHPQLWRVWSRAAAPTPSILGRTLGGYLFVPLELALVAAFYWATNTWLGWWQPSEVLSDPDILGSALPALTPIALSLQAGFMEECAFRAIPLSLAAIIGQRFGHRGAAIAAAVVVQALVFAGAHANYPGFPSYSRLVELFVPSILWALVFLRFGLVPTVILHALFDLVLMSLPLFLVDAPGAGLSRGLAIAAGLVPLGVVLARRYASGGWREFAPELRNGAWQPAAASVAPLSAAPAEGPDVSGRAAAFQRALPALGAAGLVAWALATPFRADAPGLPISRDAAEAVAVQTLAARGFVPGAGWRTTSMPRSAQDEPARWEGHRFVWREAGREAYASLLGNVLAPPLWEVRVARFDGDVAERAEEWRVTVDGTGAVRQVRHALPESRPGARLSREDARTLALAAAKERFGLDPATLADVGAEERALPARTDWAFTFGQPSVRVGEGGQARVVATVAGDEVTGYGRYVHVPEAWQRADRERESRTLVVRLVLAGILGMAGIAMLVLGVVDWTHHRRDRGAMAGVAAIALALGAARFANGWPVIAMGFVTTEPVATQAALAAAGRLTVALVLALVLALAAGVGAFAAIGQRPRPLATMLPPWAAGMAAACFVAGAGALAGLALPRAAPSWPSFGLESLAFPHVGAVLAGVQVLYAIVAVLFLLHAFARFTADWRRRGALVAVVVVALVATLSLAGASDARIAAAAGTFAGAALFAAVWGLLRYDALAAPAFVATGAVLGVIEAALAKAYAAAYVDAALAAVATAIVAWGATQWLARRRARATPPAQETPS